MIFGISDLHLDITSKKDMSVFGEEWNDYENKIFTNWKNTVNENDTVLVPGDISWAMKLHDAELDLDRIEKLPGKKILIRGNHDYWWRSISKLRNKNYSTISFLQNNSVVVEGVRVVGTRGWISPDDSIATEEDKKIFQREKNRLKLSLKYPVFGYFDTVAMLHYPPFDKEGEINTIGKILLEHGVKRCIYGHLHGLGHSLVKEGEIEGINFKCLSGDYIHFVPQKI